MLYNLRFFVLSEFLRIQQMFAGHFQSLGQPKKFQKLDCHIGRIDFPPFKTVTGGKLKRMVIVVPTFSVSHEGNPPEIGRLVVTAVIAVSPNVCGGIYEPGCVINEDEADENSPNHEWPSAHQVKNSREGDCPKNECLFKHLQNRIFYKIRTSPGLNVFISENWIIFQTPAHMRPEEPG